MKKLTLIIIAIFLLSGCVPCKANDSINKKVIVPQPEKSAKMVYASKADTIIIVPKDTIKAQVLEVAKKDSIQDSTIQAKTNEIADIKNGVKANLLGGLSIADLISAFILALIGMFIRWAYKTIRAVKKNSETPSKFNLNYWLQDSAHKLMRVLANMAVAYIFFIFCRQLLGMGLTMFVAFFIGLFIDVLADKLMNMKPDTIFKTKEENKTEIPTNSNATT